MCFTRFFCADVFNVTISYEKTSPVPYPFYIKEYEHYAHADILPWGSRVYDVSLLQVSQLQAVVYGAAFDDVDACNALLLQNNCNGNLHVRFEL